MACLAGGCATATVQNIKPSQELWTITWRSKADEDHGDGTTRGTAIHIVTLTPNERRESRKYEALDGTSISSSPEQVSPIDLRCRDAVSGLLPKLVGKDGLYSLGDDIDDEGIYSEEINIIYGGRSWRMDFGQGSRFPPMPDDVKKLLQQITACDE